MDKLNKIASKWTGKKKIMAKMPGFNATFEKEVTFHYAIIKWLSNPFQFLVLALNKKKKKEKQSTVEI